MSESFTKKGFEETAAHVRIITQLIKNQLDLNGRHPRIKIIDDFTAKVECVVCKSYVHIIARRLSEKSCLWMVGKYINHVQLHTENSMENEVNDKEIPTGENTHRSRDRSDEESNSEEEDELDLLVLQALKTQRPQCSISRSMKRNIKLTTEAARDPKQMKITSFFNTTTSNSAVRQSSNSLLKGNPHYTIGSSIKPPNSIFPSKTEDSHNLLAIIDRLPLTQMVKIIIKETVRNNFKNVSQNPDTAKGARYTDEMKNIGAYLYLMGGRKDYEELVVNLGLPSVSTILNHIGKSCEKVFEGQLRVIQLKKFLEKQGLPMFVFISEDGTKLTPRIKYDITQNQVTGLCPPLDENGIPEVGYFPATSPEVIKGYIDSTRKSSIVYVILATPAAEKTISFNLLSFGTDNKFSIDQVLLRWAIMEKQLSDHGITVLGYSADGDSRLIGSMRLRMGLPRQVTDMPQGIPDEWAHWYAAEGRFSVVYVQDTIHLVNKLKNALLSHTRALQIGKYSVSRGHLEIVARNGKEKTGLEVNDLEQHDKMCVKTFEKIIDERVTDHLKTQPGTAGTVAYISLMKSVFDAYESPSLRPLEQIEESWFVTFFMRVWHSWIKSNKNLRLDEHFITDNAEIGIEINAHSLISHLLNCRDLGKPELFLPALMNSQHCERSFGNARSMSGVQNTVINFDILEYCNKATRSEFLDQLRITLKNKFEFARGGYKTVEYQHFEFPSDLEIEAAVNRGKQRARVLLESTGLECDEEDFCCHLTTLKRSDIRPLEHVDICEEAYEENDEEPPGEDEGEEDEIFEAKVLLHKIGADLNYLCKQTVSNTGETPKGFFKVMTSTGELMLARISTVIWMLSNDRTKISNDRLLRFRTPKAANEVIAMNENQTSSFISIGDWFLFCTQDSCGSLAVAQVLGFSYLRGKLKRERECSLKTVPIEVPDSVQQPRGIGIICNKFTILNNNILSIISDPKKINITKYRSHIEKPIMTDTELKISNETRLYVDTLLEN